MKFKRLTKFYPFIFLGILIITIIIGYNLRLNLSKQPPSKTWAKEVTISNGFLNTPINMKKLYENYLIVHSDYDKIKVILCTNLGKKIKEREFKNPSNYIRNISVNKDTKNNVYISWLYSDKTTCMTTLKLNKSLEQLDKKIVKNNENLQEIKELNGGNLLLVYEDKVEIKNFSENTSINIPEKRIKSISSTQTDNGELITYINKKDGYLKYFYLKDGKITTPKNIINTGYTASIEFLYPMTMVNDNYGYTFLYQYDSHSSESNQSKYIKFSLCNNSVPEFNSINFSDYYPIEHMSPIDSKNGLRFLGTSSRPYGEKDTVKSVIDFSFNGNTISKHEYVTRTKGPAIYACYLDNLAIYADYIFYDKEKDLCKYTVCLTSTNETFKNAYNNIVTFADKSNALSLCINDIVLNSSYTLILFLIILLIFLGIYAIFSFFEYKIQDNQKYIPYIILCFILFLLKSKTLTSYFSKSSFLYIVSLVIISLISYFYGYLLYRKNTSTSLLLIITPSMLVDLFLSTSLISALIV